MLTYTKILKAWFNSIDKNTGLTLFGESLENLYTVTAKYERSLGGKSAVREKTDRFGLEIPLTGQSYTDIAFIYYFKNALVENAANPVLDGSLPLVKKIAPIYLPDNLFFLEFDTGSRNQTACPSLFFKIYSSKTAAKLLSLFQNENPYSHQWTDFAKNWEKNKSRCILRHLALMPGRSNLPVRVVFTIKENRQEGDAARDLQTLFNTFNFPFSSPDVLEKFQTISRFNLDNPCPTSYLVGLDLLPDGTWGKNIGLEIRQSIFDQPKNTTPIHRKKVVQCLKDWQLTDGRINLINDCEKILFLPDEETKEQFLFSYQLSHFKLRWHEGKPLPAKAYFQIDQI